MMADADNDDVFTGWAAQEKGAKLAPWRYTPKPLRDRDIDIEIVANGVCHSDCHMVNNDWGVSVYPLIPGGRGRHTSEGWRQSWLWLAGGCMWGLQRLPQGHSRVPPSNCLLDHEGEENLCERGYSGTILGGHHGGFQYRMRASSGFAYKIPVSLSSEDAAPVMCAGITVFTPLREYVTAPGMKVGVIAIGGLGHLAVQFAAKMGAEVTALSHSSSKEKEAKEFGAHHYVLIQDALKSHAGEFDVIINTAPVPLDMDMLIGLLANGGKLVMVGIPAAMVSFNVPGLVFGGKSIVGSCGRAALHFRDVGVRRSAQYQTEGRNSAAESGQRGI